MHVSSVPQDATRDELLGLFSGARRVNMTTLAKGFVFVDFGDEAARTAALEAAGNVRLHGRRLNVSLPKNDIHGDYRCALYFGTFDPPHEGHIALARHAATIPGVEMVYLVVNTSEYKPMASPRSARIAMLRARLEAEGCPKIALWEVDRAKASRHGSVIQDLAGKLTGRLRKNIHVDQITGQDSYEKLVKLLKPPSSSKVLFKKLNKISLLFFFKLPSPPSLPFSLSLSLFSSRQQ